MSWTQIKNVFCHKKRQQNKKFWLALGGGAARWVAHIWLIRRLEEYSIQPDTVAGTSMGSIIAALYALGISSDDMQKIASSIKIVQILDFKPFTDIMKRSAIKKALLPYIGDKTFTDTKIPLKIIATNIKTGESHIFKSGKIIDAILASSSIPGVFSPYKIGENYFIDGGMTDNLPLFTLENMPVIASSVMLPSGKDISKKSFLIKRFSVMHGAYTIMINHQEKMAVQLFKKPIHLLRLENSTVDYFDFSDTNILIEEMYKKSEGILRFLKKIKVKS